MNRNTGNTAADVLNGYSEEQLIAVFKMYGEVSSAGRLVRDILHFRANQPFRTTADLKDVAARFAPARDTARFLSQVFQGLRIEVNGEMDALKEMLLATPGVLKPGGRMVIISYHSLEDRLVKNFFRTGDVNKSQAETDIFGHASVPFKLITRKVVVPSKQEVEQNPRARSAKLRVAERVEQ